MNKTITIGISLFSNITLFCITLIIALAPKHLKNYIQVLVLLSLISIIIFYLALLVIKLDIFSNIVYCTPAVGYLYILGYPFMKYILNLLPSSFKKIAEQDIYGGIIYATIFIELYCIIVLLLPKVYSKFEFSLLYDIKITRKNLVFDIIFAGISAIFWTKFLQLGSINSVLGGTFTRRDVLDVFYTIPFYSYLKYAFVAYSVYVVIASLNSKSRKEERNLCIMRIIILSTFWIVNILAGNRREIIYFIFALILYNLNNNKFGVKKKKRDLRIYIGIVVLFILMAIIGVARIVPGNNIQNEEIIIRNALGEFIFPIQTLYFYIGNYSDNFKCGTTLINIIFYFIPRVLWVGKPITLAEQFMVDYNTTMGYAYTPLTELYINFSYAGIAIGAIALAFVLYFVCQNKNKFPLLYTAIFMQLLNFWRGEFASIVFEICIMYIVFKILLLVNGISKNKRISVK